MARIDTVSESNGPDRFNIHPGCASHHAGVKTGIKDYCCCCDPCQYVRKHEAATQPEDRFCCRCVPRIILAKFTATNGNDCCRDAVTIMVAELLEVNGVDVIKYSGEIAGYNVLVYMSDNLVGNYPADDYENTECRWTIQLPELGIDQEIPIDHVTVTCLGVPEISVTGVTAYEGCVGTISLANYSTVKVPFQTKTFTEDQSITVPFPEGFSLEGCTELPRYICVTKRQNRVNRVRSPKLPWEIEWWRDFQWDEDFEPAFSEIDQEWVIGRWYYLPNDPEDFTQKMYLIQDLYGDCFLQPNFVSPTKTNGDGEEYERVPLSSCGCDFKICNVRPVDDPAPPTTPGECLPEDLLGLNYRGGRCGCWDYYCGKRRCVPRYLCGFVYVHETLYRNILFEWNNTEKSWISTSGADLDGYDMPFTLTVSLEKNSAGQCQMAVYYEDYTIAPVEIGDTDTALEGTFEGSNYANDDYFVLNLTTSFDGNCQQVFSCQTATPCNVNCGSHPEVLYLTLTGSSLDTDYPPPPITGGCSLSITLNYYQSVTIVGSGVVYACGYVGYALVDSPYYNAETMTTENGTFLITARLSMGGVSIYRRLLSQASGTPEESFGLQTEECNPYYGYYFTSSSLKSCFFGDSTILFMRWEAEITE